MSKIDFSSLTAYIPEAVRDLNDLIKDAVFKHPEMQRYMTIVDGIEHDRKIGFYDELGDIGKKAHTSNCTLNEVTANVSTSEKTWEPKRWDTRLVLCADEINDTIAQKTLKKGINRYDMTETQYMDLFQELLIEALVKMYNRFAWIADSDAAKFEDSPPGHITNSKDLDYVNFVDAAWKQIFAIGSTTAAQRVTISENAESTYAAQADISAADALGYLEDMVYNAPLEMRQRIGEGGYEMLVTQRLYDMYAKNFKDVALESNKDDLQRGIRSLSLDGIPIIPVPEMDVKIRTWHDDGTRYWRPNRALLYNKNNLLLGVPDVRTWGEFDMFYERKDKKVYIDMEDLIDVKIHHDNLIMAAY